MAVKTKRKRSTVAKKRAPASKRRKATKMSKNVRHTETLLAGLAAGIIMTISPILVLADELGVEYLNWGSNSGGMQSLGGLNDMGYSAQGQDPRGSGLSGLTSYLPSVYSLLAPSAGGPSNQVRVFTSYPEGSFYSRDTMVAPGSGILFTEDTARTRGGPGIDTNVGTYTNRPTGPAVEQNDLDSALPTHAKPIEHILFNRTLYVGSEGADVAQLNQSFGIAGSVYTGETRTRVTQLQESAGLEPVGVLGPQTRRMINNNPDAFLTPSGPLDTGIFYNTNSVQYVQISPVENLNQIPAQPSQGPVSVQLMQLNQRPTVQPPQAQQYTDFLNVTNPLGNPNVLPGQADSVVVQGDTIHLFNSSNPPAAAGQLSPSFVQNMGNPKPAPSASAQSLSPFASPAPASLSNQFNPIAGMPGQSSVGVPTMLYGIGGAQVGTNFSYPSSVFGTPIPTAALPNNAYLTPGLNGF